MWNPLKWLLRLCSPMSNNNALALEYVSAPGVPATESQPNQAVVLYADMFPHIMDKIWAYAPNASLIRLRCVSREFKQRADSLLLDHIIYWEWEWKWTVLAEQTRAKCNEVASRFYHTTACQFLPALHSLPPSKVSTSLKSLLRPVRVLGCIFPARETYSLPLRPRLRPKVLRTCQPAFSYLSLRSVAPVFAQIHFLPADVHKAQLCVSHSTGKLVLHFPHRRLHRVQLFYDQAWHPERVYNLKEVVFICEQAPVRETKQAPIASSCSGYTHCLDPTNNTVNNNDDSSIIEALRSTVEFLYRVFTLQRGSTGPNIKIIFVNFSPEFSRCIEANRSDVGQPPPHENINVANYEAVIDAIVFVDSETYRREVGEETLRLE